MPLLIKIGQQLVPLIRSRKEFLAAKQAEALRAGRKYGFGEPDEMAVHSIQFDKTHYTKCEAMKWADDHGHKTNNMLEWPDHHAAVQRHEKAFEQYSMSSVPVATGIKMISGRLKANWKNVCPVCGEEPCACDDNVADPNEDDADDMMGMKRWEIDLAISIPDKKAPTEIKDDDGNVVDYRDVKFKGYLSTFKNLTPNDRDGDYVEPGAFAKTLAKFTRNPVALRDHVNATTHLVGKFTSIKEDSNGLLVEGTLSNSPDVRDVRFKVAEGMLTGMSMGGIFTYGEDGKQIKAVDLYEGSFTPVPANPDAQIRVRSLNRAEIKLVKKYGKKMPVQEWRAAARDQK